MIEKIAVLADSGSDLSIVKKDLPLFVLPLRIIINEKEYVDKKDISLKEVLSNSTIRRLQHPCLALKTSLIPLT